MLCIDGIIFSLQKQGGISVYFSELLKHLGGNAIPHQLLMEQSVLSLRPPTQKLIVNNRSPRWLERYRSCRLPDGSSIFHSSYYRIPDHSRVLSVVTVHDFVYERHMTFIDKVAVQCAPVHSVECEGIRYNPAL
jgi:mannosyltransferase